MYTYVAKFENFEGNEVEKTLYFNLTKAEIMRLQLSYKDGFQAYLQSVIDSKDPDAIMKVFEMLIVKAYGKRLEDGSFVKLATDAEKAAFMASEEYSALFMDLLSNEKAQTAFFLGVMPKDLAAQASAEIKKLESEGKSPAQLLESNS